MEGTGAKIKNLPLYYLLKIKKGIIDD